MNQKLTRRTFITMGISLLIVILIVYVFLGLRPTTPAAVTPTVTSPSIPSVTKTTSPSPTVKPPVTSPAVQSPSPVPGNVDFTFFVFPPTGSGFSRTFSSDITNTGNIDAHNVWVKVEASSGGTRVPVNGQDFLRVDIGTIKVGATARQETTIEFSLADGLKIMQSGAQFVLTVISDEKTQAFSYNYTP
jgi:hypothetical protein